MDVRQFDALTRALSGPGPRRRLLAVLATVPLLGSLLAVLDSEAGEAKDRRRRRKQRHQKRIEPGQRKGKRGCQPRSKATVSSRWRVRRSPGATGQRSAAFTIPAAW